jgi:predicted nucleic acid-binding protein
LCVGHRLNSTNAARDLHRPCAAPGYTAQSQTDFEALEEQLDALRQVPLTQGIVRAARAALRTLSATNHHRLPFQDTLIAASAAHKNWGVLHYDGHFDTLSEVLDFESRWIAPSGSL